jgi:hypothetical protein
LLVVRPPISVTSAMSDRHRQKPDFVRLADLNRRIEQRMKTENTNRHALLRRLIDYALDHMPVGWKRH